MRHIISAVRHGGLLLAICGLLAACADKEENAAYRGKRYPASERLEVVFQPEQVDRGCMVFAHLLVDFPAGSNGREVSLTLEEEGKKRGADTLLVGPGRVSEDDLKMGFHYYGPEQSYHCRDNWCGWMFGFDHLRMQGELVSIGVEEWGQSQLVYNAPFVVQAALLRCQE